jgi:ectoine hydroxylase-related dioxygenase (phytanoyl-CoA dioxygenase family)
MTSGTPVDPTAAGAAETLPPDRLAAAVEALRVDGFVVLPNVVDPAHLAALRERMLADLEQILARPDAPYNFNRNNVQQDPPPFPPYLFRDVLFNEGAVAVTRALLGPGLKNSYYSGNTALPGGQRQPPHPDVAQLWPGLPTATPPFGFVINVPVVAMDAANGSTELWPGTHHDTTYWVGDRSARVAAEHLARWRARRPPVQLAVPAGSLVVRDIRLWHAGMPNHTETPRPMIAMIHWVRWWGADQPVRFPKGTEAFFEHPDLRTHARFVDPPIDYLRHHEAYDLRDE